MWFSTCAAPAKWLNMRSGRPSACSLCVCVCLCGSCRELSWKPCLWELNGTHARAREWNCRNMCRRSIDASFLQVMLHNSRKHIYSHQNHICTPNIICYIYISYIYMWFGTIETQRVETNDSSFASVDSKQQYNTEHTHVIILFCLLYDSNMQNSFWRMGCDRNM